LPFRLLSRGISSITTAEISDLLGIPKNQVPQRMAPLRNRGEIISPAKGLWFPISPENAANGAPPAIDIIGALMGHMQAAYYVGWLSAARLHGVAVEDASQPFQVAVSRHIRDRMIGNSELQFYFREHVRDVPTDEMDSKNGKVNVASLETTLLDIASDTSIVGGVDRAASLIATLCELKEPDTAQMSLVSRMYTASALRRLGYIMEHFTDIDVSKLRTEEKKRQAAISLLDPTSTSSGSIESQWNLKINHEIELVG